MFRKKNTAQTGYGTNDGNTSYSLKDLTKLELNSKEVKLIEAVSKDTSTLTKIAKVVGVTVEEVRRFLDPIVEAANAHSIPLNVYTFFVAFENTEAAVLLGILSAGYTMGVLGLVKGQLDKAEVKMGEKLREDFTTVSENSNAFMFAFRSFVAIWIEIVKKAKLTEKLLKGGNWLIGPPTAFGAVVAAPALALDLYKNHTETSNRHINRAIRVFEAIADASLIHDVVYLMFQADKDCFSGNFTFKKCKDDYVFASYMVALAITPFVTGLKYKFRQNRGVQVALDYVSAGIIMSILAEMSKELGKKDGDAKLFDLLFPILCTVAIGISLTVSAAHRIYRAKHPYVAHNPENQPLLGNMAINGEGLSRQSDLLDGWRTLESLPQESLLKEKLVELIQNAELPSTVNKDDLVAVIHSKLDEDQFNEAVLKDTTVGNILREIIQAEAAILAGQSRETAHLYSNLGKHVIDLNKSKAVNLIEFPADDFDLRVDAPEVSAKEPPLTQEEVDRYVKEVDELMAKINLAERQGKILSQLSDLHNKVDKLKATKQFGLFSPVQFEADAKDKMVLKLNK